MCRNQTTFNITHWVAMLLGWSIHWPSIWCSKYFFFHIFFPSPPLQRNIYVRPMIAIQAIQARVVFFSQDLCSIHCGVTIGFQCKWRVNTHIIIYVAVFHDFFPLPTPSKKYLCSSYGSHSGHSGQGGLFFPGFVLDSLWCVNSFSMQVKREHPYPHWCCCTSRYCHTTQISNIYWWYILVVNHEKNAFEIYGFEFVPKTLMISRFLQIYEDFW